MPYRHNAAMFGYKKKVYIVEVYHDSRRIHLEAIAVMRGPALAAYRVMRRTEHKEWREKHGLAKNDRHIKYIEVRIRRARYLDDHSRDNAYLQGIAAENITDEYYGGGNAFGDPRPRPSDPPGAVDPLPPADAVSI